MAKRPPVEARYTAFLSYSHKDAAAAGRLHRRLETYRLPRRLVGSETARGSVPERLWPIFRDRDELPAATDLSETVREALAESGSLIVLCSPYSASSLWVAEEIGTFRRLHPDRPILAAILEGDPPDCFPASLRAFGRDGTWHEPLATDLRRQGDGAHLGLLKLVAGITGVGLDALVQRDASRRVRRVTAVTVGAVAAMLIMAAMALVAVHARREAESQRKEARGLAEFMHTDLRERLSSVRRLEIMRTVNERALAYYNGQLQRHDRPADHVMRARIIHAIGEEQMERGDRRGALASFREAYRNTSLLIAGNPNDPNMMFAHAQSEFWLGYYDFEADNFSPARARFERYRALANRLLATDPANFTWAKEVVYATSNLCSVDLRQRADPVAALRSCSAALEGVERLRRLRGNDPALIVDLANRHAWVADAWNRNRRWDRVLFHRARQEALVRLLMAREPRNLDYRDLWMRAQLTFGRLLAEHGDRREAQRRFADAAATVAMLRERDPENESWHSFQREIAEAME